MRINTSRVGWIGHSIRLSTLGLMALMLCLPWRTSRAQSASQLDWITVQGDHLVDASGRLVVLHGYVVPVNVQAGIVNYTLQDYQRMRSLGANYQSIRLFAGPLGAWPGQTVDPAYLAAIDNMVQLGKQVGIYTDFKLTLYGLPDERTIWEDFWNNQHGERAAVLAAWQMLWQKYTDESAVVGYDLLNEPQPFDVSAQEATPEANTEALTAFADSHLLPVYQTWIDALQRVDQHHLTLFQPLFMPKTGFIAFSSKIQRQRAVYNVHFYPYHGDYPADTWFTPNYAATLDTFLTQAQDQGTGLMVGEYGHPWSTKQDGKATLEAQERATEEGTAALFDAHLLSFSRPWFADDRSGITTSGANVGWAIFQGTNGPSGPERTIITDVVTRAFPEQVAGQQLTVRDDFPAHQVTLSYTPSAGTTRIYIPRQHTYRQGFVIQHSSGVTLVYNPTQSMGLHITQPGGASDGQAFTWDEQTQQLTIHEWTTLPVTLSIRPAS